MSNAICNTNKEIPQEMLLGNLIFINLTDMVVAESDIKQLFKNHNIPEKYVRDISQADAFRRASSSIKNRSVVMGGEDYKINVDEVRSDADGIKRIVGVKRIDSAKEDVSYESVAEIVFHRDTGSVSTMEMPFCPDVNVAHTLCEEVSNKYAEWSVYHNKDTVRNIINRIIQDTHPINLMPTGLCKFTPNTSAPLLYSLKDCLNEMSRYSVDVHRENIMEVIPVIDTSEQRGLVEKNFKVELTDELSGFVNELRDVLQKKQKITSRSAAAYIERFNMYQEKIKDYENLLGIYSGSLRAQISEGLQLIDDSQGGAAVE